MTNRHPDRRLYRAFTIISDTAIVLGAMAFVLGFIAPTTSPLPWFIAGAIVILARLVALRYRA